MLFKEGTREAGRGQMMFKFVSQDIEFDFAMIVTDRFPGRFPDVLLGVEVGRSRREEENLEPGICLEHVFDGLTLMPFGPVPEQQNRLMGIGSQHFLEEESRHIRVHDLGAQDRFLAGQEIEGAVKVGQGTAAITLDERRLTNHTPDPHEGGL